MNAAAPEALEILGGIMRAARNPNRLKVIESQEVKTEALRDAPNRVPKAAEETAGALPWVKPRKFVRVPTHVVGVLHEQRAYPRAALRLPLRLKRIAGQQELLSVTLVTKNISSSGVYFLCPRWIELGTPIELEVALVDRPLGRGSVRMTTAAHVVRVEPAETPGWHGLAASFDDITFQRDEPVPPRFGES